MTKTKTKSKLERRNDEATLFALWGRMSKEELHDCLVQAHELAKPHEGQRTFADTQREIQIAVAKRILQANGKSIHVDSIKKQTATAKEEPSLCSHKRQVGETTNEPETNPACSKQNSACSHSVKPPLMIHTQDTKNMPTKSSLLASSQEDDEIVGEAIVVEEVQKETQDDGSTNDLSTLLGMQLTFPTEPTGMLHSWYFSTMENTCAYSQGIDATY